MAIQANDKNGSTPVIGKVYRFLISLRLAFFLIAIIAVLSLIGSLVIQAPADVRSDPAEYTWWLNNVAREATGAWTGILALLQLFNVFTSPWFIGAGVLLIVNIVFCTANRFKHSLRMVKGGEVKQEAGFYRGLPDHSETSGIPASPDSVVTSLTGELKKRRYRVRVEKGGAAIFLAAEKNRFAPLGTYLTHLSIIILIAGFLVGNLTGFEDPSFIVAEGEKRDVGFGTGLSLYLDSFTDEYWENGMPKDYRSRVVLYKDGSEVSRGDIRVNYPIEYGGVRFYQSFFGTAVRLNVKSADGRDLFQGSVPLPQVIEMGGVNRPVGALAIPGTALTAYLVAPVGTDTDPLIKPGQLVVEIYDSSSQTSVARGTLVQGTPQSLAGTEFSYLDEGQFSGFQVKSDPGTWLIWLASALFLLGTFLVFYFPYRSVRALVESQPAGSRLLIGMSAPNRAGKTELQSIVDALSSKRLAGKG